LWGAASLEVITTSGVKFKRSLKYALGERENPLPPDVLKKKFMTMSCENIDEHTAIELFDILSDFSKIKDMKNVVSKFIDVASEGD
jgi:hypothetical protein